MTHLPNTGAPRARHFLGKALRLPVLGALAIALIAPVAHADTTPFNLASGNFSQDWSNTGLITVDDDWTGVPSITGYLGDLAGATTNRDARLVVAPSTTIDVVANQTNPNVGNGSGGVFEFEIANPTIGIAGSGTADAPYISIFLNTTARTNVTVAYLLRDLETSADDAVQQIALQYRVGSTGNFTNLAGAYVADATAGPNVAGPDIPVSALLPAAVENQPLVEVRILTTNAAGSDEYVGIDDISVTSNAAGGNIPTDPFVSANATPNTVNQGGTTLLQATVTPGTNPASTGITVSGDLTSIGGSATQAFLDNGMNGDAAAGDGIYSYTATVPAATAPGAKTLPVTVTDAQTRTGSTTISLTVNQVFAVSTTVVISEFRSRGADGAGDEFIELYNLSSSPVDISGYTVQYASSGGSISVFATVPASTTLPAGSHYLLTSTGGPLEAQGDVNYDAGFAETGGIALFDATSNRIDAVGYATGTPYKEGAGLPSLPDPNNANQSYERLPLTVNNQDTQDNVADFQTTNSNPQSLKGEGNSAPVVDPTINSPVVPGPTDLVITDPRGSDADGDALTYTFVFAINGTTIAGEPGFPNRVDLSKYTVAVGDTFTATFTANDGTTDSAPVTLTRTIAAPPVANPASGTAQAGVRSAIGPITGTDPNGLALRYVLLTQPTSGSAFLAGSASNVQLFYTSAPGFSGADSVTYQVVNSEGRRSAPATISITVAGNSAPTASDGSATVTAGVRTEVPLTASDADGDALRYRIATGPTNGNAFLANNTSGGVSLFYTANRDYSGADSVAFSVTDPSGASATGTISLTVQGNSAPTANAASLNATTGQRASVVLSGSDPDGDALVRYRITSQPSNGTAFLAGSGDNVRLFYTSNAGYTGADSVQFTITDSTGRTSAPATVSVTVSPAASAAVKSGNLS